MFLHTLWIGWLVGLLTSFIVESSIYGAYLSPFEGKELIGLFLFYSGKGLTYTVIAQTGFFAYLFINLYGQNFFKSFWPTVQVLIIAFVLFDIVYFTSKELSLTFRIGLMLIILLAGIVVAIFKVRQTNGTAFIPALFVMVVILTLELSLVLRTGEANEIILMLMPLLVATAFQLIMLHHVTKIDPEHQRRIEQRRKQRREQQKQRQKELASKNKQSKQNEEVKGKTKRGNNHKKKNKRKNKTSNSSESRQHN